MSAPVFLTDSSALRAQPGGIVAVRGAQGRHGARVKRLRVGETVELVDGSGTRVTGEVDAVTAVGFDVLIRWIRCEPVPGPTITVVQGLAKGDRGELAVEMLTEVGVDRIVPWQAARSVAVWRHDRAERGRRRWQAVAGAATEQSRRSRIPEVTRLASTEDVVAAIGSAESAFILHEVAPATLVSQAVAVVGSMLLVVGPEGGITDSELSRFTAAGGTVVRLGESILRTSTAGVVAASLVMARCGRWQ